MDWGSVPDWLTAIASIGLASAAIFAAQQGIKNLNAWRTEAIGKRKAELAEQALTTVYEARDVFRFVRTPVLFLGEEEAAKPETIKSGETKTVSSRYSVSIQRIQREKELFARLQTQRYSFAAIFGAAATKPFDDIADVQISIVTAATTLIQTEGIE